MANNRFGVELVGATETALRVRQIGDRALSQYQEGVDDEAQAIFQRTQELVPVDTGALKKSGRIERASVSAQGVAISIAYGGGEVDYAGIVHEDLAARHAPPTQAKYIEQPLLEQLPGMADRLAGRVRKALR